jgi:hypothetical protein
MVSLKYVRDNNLNRWVCNTCNQEKDLDKFPFWGKWYNNRCKVCCSNLEMKKYVYSKKFPITCKVCGKIKYTYYKRTIYCSAKCHNKDTQFSRNQYYYKVKNLPRFIEKRRTSNKIWKNKNKDKVKIYCKNTYEKNKKKYQKSLLDKLKKDKIFRLQFYFRNSIRDFFSKRKIKKDNPTSEILGCDWDTLIKHLESQFKPGMSFENYGGKRCNPDGTKRICWEIDHIIPICKAKTKEEIIKFNHYTNLRPLWWWENIEEEIKSKCYYHQEKL